VFVCPSQIACLLVLDVRFTRRNLTITPTQLAPTFSSLLFNSARVTLDHYPRPLFPRCAHKLTHGSGKRTEFLAVSVVLMPIHCFHTLATRFGNSGRALRRYLESGFFFIYDCTLPCSFCARGFFRATIYPPEPCFSFRLPSTPPHRSVVTTVPFVRPPGTSSHSCRARRSCSCFPPLSASFQLRNSRHAFLFPS